MIKKPEQLIDEQVRTWSYRQSIMRRESPEEQPWPIITLSREFGAHGSALARRLSERTGFRVWDRELVYAVAQTSGEDVRMMETLDEHTQRTIEDAIQGIVTRSRYTNLNYLRTLIRVLRTIAAHGSSIVVGRGANYVCRPNEALRVRVVCPLAERVRRYAESERLDPSEARRHVEAMDADRADFVARSFRRDLKDPADYDLVLNSGTYGVDALADLVLEAYTARVGRNPAMHVEVARV